MEVGKMNPDNPQRENLASLDVKAELELLPVVLKLVRDVTTQYGLEKSDARDMELATEEACHNVIEHAYEPEEKGRYQVEIVRDPTSFTVTVKDQGLPFNLEVLDEDKPTDLGFKLMRAFTDEVNSKYLGKRGKEVELVKYLPFKAIDPLITDAESSEGVEAIAPKSEEVTLRLMRPEETVSLARCIYRVYGYTYPHEDIYYPQKFASLVESGLVTSCVAVNKKEEVIGHLGVFLEIPEDPVGESALVAVDPRYRGRGLFPRMKEMMVGEMASRGLRGLYGRAVTVHVATQKSNLKMGSKETGFILAHSPPTTIFKKMTTKESDLRRTVALFYIPVLPDEEQRVFLPPAHDKMLRKIYDHTELQRVFNEPFPEEKSFFHSEIHSHLLPEMGSAFLRVNNFGVDFLSELRSQVKELCLRQVELIVLDLPLKNPVTSLLCPEIENIGFFFSGLMPEYLNGDALRLQYLNNVVFDPDTVDVYSDFAKEIFSYVVEQWQTHTMLV
jgi:anti-sigma regulatory factor (Ser/Thr protein kinase)